MALDRQSIEKKDFPIGRRGYDPDAVDAHLASLADEVDELRRSSRRRTETLASTASEQVRAIVEAAETSAAEIQRQAEDEAREIRAEASSEAQSTREQATAQAREYVGKVSESTAVMLQRLDAMESELERAGRVAAHRLEPSERRSAAARGQPQRGSRVGLPRGQRFEAEEYDKSAALPEAEVEVEVVEEYVAVEVSDPEEAEALVEAVAEARQRRRPMPGPVDAVPTTPRARA